MGKYVITGGAGFIGSHLADYLICQGHEVVIIDNFYTGKHKNIHYALINKNCKLEPTSILDSEKCMWHMVGADAVIHLAAIVNVMDCEQKPDYSKIINVDGFYNILGCAEACNVKKVILASSAAVYGEPENTPSKEGDLTRPISNYGKNKETCEHLARNFNERVEVIIYRFFNVYGPRQDASSPYSGVISKFINQMLNKEESTIFGNGEQTRDFIYVGDLVKAIIQHGLSEETKTGVYNLGTGKGTSINKLYETLAFLMSKHGSMSVQCSYSQERPAEIKHSVADIKKICCNSSWRSYITLENGLKKTIDYYKELKNES